MVHRRHTGDKHGVGQFTRRVWRITPNAPHGEYVDPDQLPQELSRPAERPEPGWLVSSFELTRGLDVSDESDTIPGELFDEFFKKKA